MACPEDSRQVEDARPPDLGTDRLPAAPEVAATTQSDLEDLPAQSPGSDGFHRLLHRAYDHDEGVVRVPGVGTSSSRGAAFPGDGASLCSLDVPADRLDPQGLPGPFHHLQREASE